MQKSETYVLVVEKITGNTHCPSVGHSRTCVTHLGQALYRQQKVSDMTTQGQEDRLAAVTSNFCKTLAAEIAVLPQPISHAPLSMMGCQLLNYFRKHHSFGLYIFIWFAGILFLCSYIMNPIQRQQYLQYIMTSLQSHLPHNEFVCLMTQISRFHLNHTYSHACQVYFSLCLI